MCATKHDLQVVTVGHGGTGAVHQVRLYVLSERSRGDCHVRYLTTTVYTTTVVLVGRTASEHYRGDRSEDCPLCGGLQV